MCERHGPGFLLVTLVCAQPSRFAYCIAAVLTRIRKVHMFCQQKSGVIDFWEVLAARCANSGGHPARNVKRTAIDMEVGRRY